MRPMRTTPAASLVALSLLIGACAPRRPGPPPAAAVTRAAEALCTRGEAWETCLERVRAAGGLR